MPELLGSYVGMPSLQPLDMIIHFLDQSVVDDIADRVEDLAGKPLVLAFFSSDVAFDEQGEVCPGWREALLTLQSLTDNGSKPRVLGVQVGIRGKPGAPLVVPGVTLTLAHEETPVVQNSFGLTAMVAFAFVQADGSIAATYDRAPTEEEITQSLTAL